MCVRVVVVVLVFSREGKVSKKLVGYPQVRNPSSTAICKVRKKKGGKSKENPATLQLQHFVKKKKPKRKKHKFQTKLHLLSSSCKRNRSNRNQRNIPTRERERGGEAGHESKCMS